MVLRDAVENVSSSCAHLYCAPCFEYLRSTAATSPTATSSLPHGEGVRQVAEEDQSSEDGLARCQGRRDSEASKRALRQAMATGDVAPSLLRSWKHQRKVSCLNDVHLCLHVNSLS